MSRSEEAQKLIETFEEVAKKPEFNFFKDDTRASMKLSIMMDMMMSLAVIADKLTEGSENG